MNDLELPKQLSWQAESVFADLRGGFPFLDRGVIRSSVFEFYYAEYDCYELDGKLTLSYKLLANAFGVGYKKNW